MATESESPPDTSPPRSPWAKKFGIPETNWPSLTENGHSSLAPRLPYLDPRWYGTPLAGGFATPLPRPVREGALDELFVSERLQQSHLAGMRTWQAAALNARLAGGLDGGHDADAAPPTMDMATALRVATARQAAGLANPQQQGEDKWNREDAAELLVQLRMLTVNEAGWCEVFARERWFDLHVKVKGKLPNTVGAIGDDDIWSVDNPVIWNEMRPCLELADRLLKASVESGL